MTLDTIIMLLGAFIAILPFLGFPASWDTVLFFLAGIAVIALGIAVRRRGSTPVVKKTIQPKEFVESRAENKDL